MFHEFHVKTHFASFEYPCRLPLSQILVEALGNPALQGPVPLPQSVARAACTAMEMARSRTRSMEGWKMIVQMCFLLLFIRCDSAVQSIWTHARRATETTTGSGRLNCASGIDSIDINRPYMTTPSFEDMEPKMSIVPGKPAFFILIHRSTTC